MYKIFDYSDKPIPLEKIKETWELVFNKKFNLKYFEWRFKNNPNEKKIYIKYIIENDTLTAYYAVSPMLLEKKGGEIIKVALANMTMTHPNYRGKGYTKLLALKLYAQLKKEGYACVYTYPVRETMCHIFRKHLNFIDLAILKTMHLSKDFFKHTLITDYSFELGSVNKEIINKAQNFTFTEKKLLLLRNKANLKWRLMDNPINNYYYLMITCNNKTKGIIFYKCYNDSIDIMDYCYSADDGFSESDFSAGLDYLFSQKNHNIRGINIWTDVDSKEFNFLESIGFLPTDINTYFGVIPLNNDKTLLCKENWYNRYFDSDVY